MSLGQLVQVCPQYGAIGALIGLGKVCGDTEARVISFCFGGRSRQVRAAVEGLEIVRNYCAS